MAYEHLLKVLSTTTHQKPNIDILITFVTEVDKMGRIVHFDMSSGDPDKTVEFYEKIFGWKFLRWNGPVDYLLITTGPDGDPGINGGMSRKGDNEVPKCTTIDVKDLDKTIQEIQHNGGKIIVPKMPVPGIGWLAYFKDSEDNFFGLMQEDKNAGME